MAAPARSSSAWPPRCAPVGAPVARGSAAAAARYYILTQGSIALGLLDHLRHGTAAGWDPPEGTR